MDAYVNYVFNTSVQDVFQEFERGFFQVCDRKLVGLFRPEELQEFLVGKDVYDWNKLKQVNANHTESDPVYLNVLSHETPLYLFFFNPCRTHYMNCPVLLTIPSY